ncbi:hypothetical protein CsSME_00031710 [Camellia sinensis var. sinensis]
MIRFVFKCWVALCFPSFMSLMLLFNRRRVDVVLWGIPLFRIGLWWLQSLSHVILSLVSLKLVVRVPWLIGIGLRMIFGKDRHDREHCWKLHGHPTRGRSCGSGVHPQARVFEITASAPGDTGSISQDELRTLRRLMAWLDSLSTLTPFSSVSSNFADIGISTSALSTSSLSHWIIDSGAADHMIGPFRLRLVEFSKYDLRIELCFEFVSF